MKVYAKPKFSMLVFQDADIITTSNLEDRDSYVYKIRRWRNDKNRYDK